MSDLQCPVRVHLTTPGGGGPEGERVALALDLGSAPAAKVIEEILDAADLYRGEAVAVAVAEDVRREVADRLVGDPDAVRIEGDADGWRPVG